MATVMAGIVRNARGFDRYMDSVEAHDDSGVRSWFTSASGTTPEYFVTDALRVKKRLGKEALPVELRHVIQSFSAEEFDPADLDSGYQVHMLGRAFAQEAFPGHQFKVATQRDGHSGLWHNHIGVANVAHKEGTLTWYSRDEQTGALVEKQEHRKAGSAFSATMASQTRMRRVNDRVIERELGRDNAAFIASRGRPSVRNTVADLNKRSKGQYNWRDDLREKIDAARGEAIDFDDFAERLAADGVFLRERGAEGNLSYRFIDAESKERTARALGRNGLGNSVGREEVDAQLLENAQRAQQPIVVTPTITAHPMAHGTDQTRADDLLVELESQSEALEDTVLAMDPRAETSAQTMARIMADAPPMPGGDDIEADLARIEAQLNPPTVETKTTEATEAATEAIEVENGTTTHLTPETAPESHTEPQTVAQEAGYRSPLRDARATTDRMKLTLANAAAFDELAKAQLDNGERITESDVPSGMGPAFLGKHGEKFDPKVFEQLEMRATKRARHQAAYEAAVEAKRKLTELRDNGGSPLSQEAEALRSTLKTNNGVQAKLKTELEAGQYEPVVKKTTAKVTSNKSTADRINDAFARSQAKKQERGHDNSLG